LIAANTRRIVADVQQPGSAIATNQTTMIGPKNAATRRGSAPLHREQTDQDRDRMRTTKCSNAGSRASAPRPRKAPKSPA
jgi:hypothetical protein